MNGYVLKVLQGIFGAEHVLTEERVLGDASLDLSPRNLLQRERPFPTAAVVVRPNGDAYTDQLQRLIGLALSQEPKLRIIARGGGSGVCGALNASGGEVIVDFSLLRGVRIVPRDSQYFLVLEPGASGEDIDAVLQNYPVRLEHGHYPASYYISTFGGWVQAAGSGQYSMEFGTIKDIVSQLEIVDGTGARRLLQGDEMAQAIGMEGTTCFVTEGMMRLVPAMPEELHLTITFGDGDNAASFLHALQMHRTLLQNDGASVYAVRCYDWFDRTFVAKPHKGASRSAGSSRRLQYAAERWLASHGRVVDSAVRLLESVGIARWTCLIYVRGNDQHGISNAQERVEDLARLHRGAVADSGICRTWHENRFKLGYEKLVVRYDAGILADTFECTPTWVTAVDTYDNVRRALSRFGVVGAHMGVDLQGPYWYFTFALPTRSESTHRGAWSAALDACISSGARTNHHHGIGKLKAGPRNSLASYANGTVWYEYAKEVKQNMDPHRILNPANLV